MVTGTGGSQFCLLIRPWTTVSALHQRTRSEAWNPGCTELQSRLLSSTINVRGTKVSALSLPLCLSLCLRTHKHQCLPAQIHSAVIVRQYPYTTKLLPGVRTVHGAALLLQKFWVFFWEEMTLLGFSENLTYLSRNVAALAGNLQLLPYVLGKCSPPGLGYHSVVTNLERFSTKSYAFQFQLEVVTYIKTIQPLVARYCKPQF